MVGLCGGEMLTVDETARRLGLSPWTVRKWIATKRLDVVRLGRALRVPASSVEAKIADGFRKAD